MAFEQLKLENQLCFPVYAASRLINRTYQPLLEQLDLTYPQYLVMMYLWEHRKVTVGQLSEAMYLNTNTLSPLLKRLAQQGLVRRERDAADERKVFIRLSEAGLAMEEKAAQIPLALMQSLGGDPEGDLSELQQLKEGLEKIIQHLSKAK